MTKWPRSDFSFRSISQISTDSDAVAKNDEIVPTRFFFRSISQILAHTDTVVKNDEIAPARFLLPINQSNFGPFRHRREK